MATPQNFRTLTTFLERLPGIRGSIGSGASDDGRWWVKFVLDLDHPLAWNVVQELGHVLNYISLEERLPTVFMPVSPPPYMNGGPRQFLSWVIEAQTPDFSPADCTRWLEARLPPHDDISAWQNDDDDDDPDG